MPTSYGYQVAVEPHRQAISFSVFYIILGGDRTSQSSDLPLPHCTH